jgi:hypothetical protein
MLDDHEPLRPIERAWFTNQNFRSALQTLESRVQRASQSLAVRVDASKCKRLIIALSKRLALHSALWVSVRAHDEGRLAYCQLVGGGVQLAKLGRATSLQSRQHCSAAVVQLSATAAASMSHACAAYWRFPTLTTAIVKSAGPS